MNEIIVTGRKLQLSEATRRLNPHLFKAEAEKAACVEPMAGLVRSEPQHREVQTLASRSQKQTGRKEGALVCRVLIVRYGRKILDDDNLAASYKGLRDHIATLVSVDDGDSRIKFEYAQVVTRGITGTNVVISRA